MTRRRYTICTNFDGSKGGNDASRRQIEIHRQGKTAGRAHRGRLRETRSAGGRGRASSLGDGEQGARWRRETRRRRLRETGKSRADAKGRKDISLRWSALSSRKQKGI